MKKTEPFGPATTAAERVVREHQVTALPVDPIAIATAAGIEVVAKPASNGGVSGMLLRVDDLFCIAYATHISSPGFRRFSIAHELGHYFLPGHVDAVLTDDGMHESRAGFVTSDPYEMEADYFAARLLMPNALFTAALRRAGEGLAAVEELAGRCGTSLTATAIRYTQCSREPVAMIISCGNAIDYCFMSDALKDVDGLDWVRKRQTLPRTSVTAEFNQDTARIARADRTTGTSALQDWFGGALKIEVTEDVVGLGEYGKTLTILHGSDLPEEDEDEELEESWTPRFRR
jgi:Zn-dependent peptidase ImmA (M78 family)